MIVLTSLDAQYKLFLFKSIAYGLTFFHKLLGDWFKLVNKGTNTPACAADSNKYNTPNELLFIDLLTWTSSDLYMSIDLSHDPWIIFSFSPAAYLFGVLNGPDAIDFDKS